MLGHCQLGMKNDNWSTRLRHAPNGKGRVYVGSALRTMASLLHHHDAIIGFAAALRAEAARSPDCDLLELLPTYRSSIGYYHFGAGYVVHRDVSFQLAYRGDCRPYFLEFERRATTPKRVRAQVLFVFETPEAEDAFQRAAGRSHHVPLLTSILDLLTERGVLGNVWRLPPPHPCDRGSLQCLHKVQFCPQGRSQHFL